MHPQFRKNSPPVRMLIHPAGRTLRLPRPALPLVTRSAPEGEPARGVANRRLVQSPAQRDGWSKRCLWDWAQALPGIFAPPDPRLNFAFGPAKRDRRFKFASGIRGLSARACRARPKPRPKRTFLNTQMFVRHGLLPPVCLRELAGAPASLGSGGRSSRR